MSDCFYCPLPKGQRIRFERPWCSACKSPSEDFTGEYFDDVKRGEATFHLIQLDTPAVCKVCGHSSDVISRPCGGNAVVKESNQIPCGASHD